MCESLLKALANSSILLIGILILSNSKYKKPLLFFGYLTMIFVSSYTFNFGFQAGIASLAIIIMIYSRFTRDSWRYTFFIITNIISVGIISKYWSNFVALIFIDNFNLTNTLYLEASLIIQIFISIGIYRVLMWIFKGIGIHLFLDTLEREHSRIMIIALFSTQALYVLVSFIPNLSDEGDHIVTTIQTIYTTILAAVMLILLVLFRHLVRHKIDSQEKNATLEQVSQALAVVEIDLAESKSELVKTQKDLEANEQLIGQAAQELKEKERLLRFMDQQVTTLSEARRKLMDFEHDQLNFIIALDGGIRSGDTAVMRESLEQYGAAVQEVLELKSDAVDLSNLYDSRMMPIRYLVLAKAQLATSQGVKFTLEIPTEVSRIGMDLKDFVRILGIWLDNAIEEAIQLDDKWIHVSFILNHDDDEGIDILEVRVSNSCRPKQSSEIAKLHEHGFTTKGDSRGNGLRIVHDLMFKHENIHIETRVKADDDKFTQLLSIALQKK